MDMGTNTSDIEVRPHKDEARVVTLDANVQAPLPIVDVMIPSGGGDPMAIPQINLSILGYGPNSLRNSHVGTPAMGAQEISILPQLDGPVSILARGPTGGRVSENIDLQDENIPKGAPIFKGPPFCKEGNTPERVVMMIISTGDHIGIRDCLKEEDIQVRVEGHLMEEDIPIGMGGLLKEDEDPLMVEDPIMEMEEDPLMVEDPLMEMRTRWTPQWTRTTRPSRTPWTSETYSSTDSSSNTGYLCLGEYIRFSGTVYAAVG